MTVATKELTANAKHIYQEALSLQKSAMQKNSTGDLFQSGIDLDLRIEELFRKIVTEPLRENMDAFITLNAARGILIQNQASIILEETPSMIMADYAHIFTSKDLNPSASLSECVDPIVMHVNQRMQQALGDKDKEAVYRTIWELTGKRAGNPLQIGQALFESPNPAMSRLKADALAMVALKKYEKEFADRSIATVAPLETAAHATVAACAVSMLVAQETSERIIKIDEIESRLSVLKANLESVKDDRASAVQNQIMCQSRREETIEALVHGKEKYGQFKDDEEMFNANIVALRTALESPHEESHRLVYQSHLDRYIKLKKSCDDLLHKVILNQHKSDAIIVKIDNIMGQYDALIATCDKTIEDICSFIQEVRSCLDELLESLGLPFG